MALSPLINATVQAAFLNGLSSVLAQLITAYREGVSRHIFQPMNLN